jgi:glycoside/pentoside/hexuronide:cation symporter, GPH family
VVGGMALAPRCVRHLGTLRSMQLCNLVAGGALVGLFGASFGPSWVSWLMAAGLGLGWGVIGILIQTAILDAARLCKPGLPGVALGFYLGIMMAGIKLGTSAGGFLSGEFLDLVGFMPGGARQSVLTSRWIRIGYVLLPLVFVLASELALRKVPRESSSGSQLAASTPNPSL